MWIVTLTGVGRSCHRIVPHAFAGWALSRLTNANPRFPPLPQLLGEEAVITASELFPLSVSTWGGGSFRDLSRGLSPGAGKRNNLAETLQGCSPELRPSVTGKKEFAGTWRCCRVCSKQRGEGRAQSTREIAL